MKIQNRVEEVELNIKNLKVLAKKHIENKKPRLYKTICEAILQNEQHLSSLKKDLKIIRRTNLTV